MEQPFSGNTLPQIKSYSLENFGQIVKVSADLSPDVFPYKVLLPVSSGFFKSAYYGVYEGINTSSRIPSIFIERQATIAASEKGELMVSKDVFQGTTRVSLSSEGKKRFDDHLNLLRTMPFPPGWRSFGVLHSHPLIDIANQAVLHFDKKVPKVNGIPISWSFR